MVGLLKIFMPIALLITVVWFAIVRMAHIVEEERDTKKVVIKIWAYLMALMFVLIAVQYFGGGGS